MRLFAAAINLDSITLFFFSIFLEIQKIHEELLLKTTKKLETLSQTVWKIDVKFYQPSYSLVVLFL